MTVALPHYEPATRRRRMKHAGHIFREKRLKLGMNQDDAGDLLGVGQTTVSNWEKTGNIPFARIDEIASEMQIDADLLRETTRSVPQNRDEDIPEVPQTPYAIGRHRRAEWLSLVMRDAALSSRARTSLAMFADEKFLRNDRSPECFINKYDLVEENPDVNEENRDDVWAEILASKYVEPLADNNRVLLLTFPGLHLSE